jgi:hypothetical protein
MPSIVIDTNVDIDVPKEAGTLSRSIEQSGLARLALGIEIVPE